MRNKNKSGFTLIELLVVIAIIGLLASVVLLALNSARSKARDAKRVADVRQIATALEMYFNDKNTYPTTAAGQAYLFSAANVPGLTPNYIGTMPAAPTPAETGCAGNYNPNTQIANDYNYQSANSATAYYTLTFCLGGSAGSLGAGVHTLTPAGLK